MKKKKLMILALAVLLLLAVVAGVGVYHYQLPRFHDVSVELGTSHVPLEHFLTIHGNADRASFVTDLSDMSWDTVGTTQVTLQQSFKQETVTLTIRDTIAPKVEFLTHRTEAVDYEPKAEDFVLSVKDSSALTVAFEKMPQKPSDYQDVTVTVVVTDAHGNSVKQACVLSYSWLRSQVTLELGQELTRADVLVDAKNDWKLIRQEDLDDISAAGVGAYSITSTSGGKTVTCVVTVRDTTKPELTLKEVQTYQGDSVKPEDFVQSVTDLSNAITLQFAKEPDWDALGSQTVTVEAVDASGNVTAAEAKLEVIADTEPPVINFNGKLTVSKGTEPNYLKDVNAFDARDGVVEVRVDASGVDLNTPGPYTVTYSVTDAAGNTAQKKRQVVVSPSAEDTAKLVKEVAAQFGNDPEAIRDYVRAIKYTSNWGGDDPVWFGLTNQHGNCYVHNMTLKALLEEKGYETQLIWVREEYDPHYWLLIKLDGKWKHIDGTPGNTHTRYSLMNDQQRLETLKGREWDFSRWPACE